MQCTEAPYPYQIIRCRPDLVRSQINVTNLLVQSNKLCVNFLNVLQVIC